MSDTGPRAVYELDLRGPGVRERPIYILPDNITKTPPVVDRAIAEYNKTGRQIVFYDGKCGTCPELYHEVENHHVTVSCYLTPLTAHMLEYALLTAGVWKTTVFGEYELTTIQRIPPATLAKILDIAKIDPEAFPNVPRSDGGKPQREERRAYP